MPVFWLLQIKGLMLMHINSAFSLMWFVNEIVYPSYYQYVHIDKFKSD